jgi:hypothetical protein
LRSACRLGQILTTSSVLLPCSSLELLQFAILHALYIVLVLLQLCHLPPKWLRLNEATMSSSKAKVFCAQQAALIIELTRVARRNETLHREIMVGEEAMTVS